MDFEGGDNYIFGGELIASNMGIVDEFLDKAKHAFGKQ
jgi:hypothetical protein